MAIFASTTTSGYSDPLKAQSIKALEQRLKDQQAQMAAQQPDAAMMATIPGGIGHVLGVVGDKMNQARSDQALVANRADLAKVMSGYDRDKGMTGEQAAVLSRVAPDVLEKLMGHEQERWKTTTTEAGATGRTNIQETAATGRTQIQEDAANARNAATVGVTREGQKLDADVKREGYQVQIDLADKKNQAQREEAIADREFKGAQAELDRAQQTGTEAQKATAALRLSDAQNKLDMARAAANKAAELQNSREGRTATASESALERAHREQAQATDLAFKGGEGAAERASRKDLQVGQQQFTGTENAEERALKERLQKVAQAFQGGESAEERALRERLQGKSLEATSTEKALDRTATSTDQAARLKSDADIAAATRALTTTENALNRAQQTGERIAIDEATRARDDAKAKYELILQGVRDEAAGARQTQAEAATGARQTQAEAATKENQAAQIASHEKIAASTAAAKAAELASDPKRQGEVATLGEKYARQHQAVTKLEKAVSILNNGGINTGPWARAETVAANLANGRFGTDKDMAQRTTDFNSLVNEATIQQMSETLKGQTTNFEMEKFIEVMNNPSASPEHRKEAIERLVNAAKVGRDLSANAFTQAGGKMDIIHQHLGGGSGGGGGGGGGAGGVVSGITEAEAMKLAPGTRFKLKDGRTGTAE